MNLIGFLLIYAGLTTLFLATTVKVEPRHKSTPTRVIFHEYQGEPSYPYGKGPNDPAMYNPDIAYKIGKDGTFEMHVGISLEQKKQSEQFQQSIENLRKLTNK